MARMVKVGQRMIAAAELLRILRGEHPEFIVVRRGAMGGAALGRETDLGDLADGINGPPIDLGDLQSVGR